MASHSGDSPAKESVARWPLSEVTFTSPTKVSGISTMLTTLEANVTRLVDGREWSPPEMWFDPVHRLIYIDGLSYPMERIHCFRRAPAKLAKRAPKLNLDQYHIGKR